MRRYIITIEEVNNKDFEVYANSVQDAIGKAIENYKNGNFILDPGDCTFKQIAISRHPNGEREWFEF